MNSTAHHASDSHAHEENPFPMVTLGFWIYLMTDCLLFGSLFCTYAVLHHNTFGGPSSQELFDLKLVGFETAALLISSITCGFATLSSLKMHKNRVVFWYAITFLLGASFLVMEFMEFSHLVAAGHSWKTSAFLSSFFTLVGTHGCHVSVGLLWLLVMIWQIATKGITVETFRRMVVFSLFWHFLDVVWIFVFTFVYLMGVI